MNNRVEKAALYNGLSKKAAQASTITASALSAAFAVAAGIGGLGGMAWSKLSSPTDTDIENARKEYQSSALDAAINELTVKLNNERYNMPRKAGSVVAQRAMRLM